MTRPNPCMAQFQRCFSTKRSSASFDPGNTILKVLAAASETNGSHYVNRALDLDLKIFPLFEKCFSSIYDKQKGAFASTTKGGKRRTRKRAETFLCSFFPPCKSSHVNDPDSTNTDSPSCTDTTTGTRAVRFLLIFRSFSLKNHHVQTKLPNNRTKERRVRCG